MKNRRLFKAMITVFALVLSLGLMLTGCASKTPQQADDTQVAASQPPDAPAETPAEKPIVQPEQEVSFVMLDINPSIQLTVEQGLVTEVQAFNDDGTGIILQSDVNGLTAHDAIDILIGELGNQGYINEQDAASLVITVSGSENEGLAEGLKDRAQERVKEMNMECEVISATVSDEDIEAAKAIGMSAGRYLVIKHIADVEGILFEEAIEKYGEAKMKDLLDMVGDVDEIFGDDEELQDLLDTLTEEQQTVLTAAIDVYSGTVKTAQKAFIQAGKDAQKLFKEGKKVAQEAFKSDKDTEKWQQAKTELKKQFYTAKSEAKKIAQQAKKDAELAFLEAVSGLGLSDDVIDDLLNFVFDFEWEDIDDFDDEDDLDDDEDDEDDADDDDKDDADDDEDEGEGKGRDKENPGKGNKDDDDADDDDDDDDDEDDNDE